MELSDMWNICYVTVVKGLLDPSGHEPRLRTTALETWMLVVVLKTSE